MLKAGSLKALPSTGVDVNVNQPAGKPVIEALRAALKGKVIGVPLSTSQQQFIEDNFKRDVEVRSYKSSEAANLDLMAGRIDAQFDNIVYLSAAAALPANADMAIAGPKLVGGQMATDVCIGIRKNEPDLQALLDKAIGSMINDGTVRRLAVQWFTLDLSPK